jgi:hypothetical protein
MDEKPKRRWFRFRLSTVLILTAITAWGMACRPWIDWHHERTPIVQWRDLFPQASLWAGISWNDHGPISSDDRSRNPNNLSLNIQATFGEPRIMHSYQIKIGPTRVLWPIVPGIVLLTWQRFRAMVEHRRRQSVTPE